MPTNTLQQTLDLPREFTANGRTVQSTYTDEEVYDWARCQNNGFLRSVTSNPLTRLSVKQIACLHVNRIESETPRNPRPQPVTLPVVTPPANCKAIVELFNNALTHLKSPQVKIHAGTDTVAFRRFGTASRYYGQISITNGRTDDEGNRIWFGRIDSDGIFYASRDGRHPALCALLDEFNADPAGTAAKYGKLSGKCCFCNRPLTADNSTEVGYGPICADHYGLPWG